MPTRDYLAEGDSSATAPSPRQRRRNQFLLLVLVVLALWGLRRGGLGRGVLEGPSTPQVGAVFDGDTLDVHHLKDHQRIRLYCIDAPESDQPPWGGEARDELRALAPAGTEVRLDVRARDAYGRLVAEVFVGEKNLNLVMVEAGRAAVYSRFCQDDAYFEAEARARDRNLGIWSSPGLHQTPWKWRHHEEAPHQPLPNPSAPDPESP